MDDLLSQLLPAHLRWMLPAALLLAALAELLWLRRRGHGMDWRESAASLGMAAGQRLAGAVTAVLLGGVYWWCWAHRPWTVPLHSAWGLPLLFLGAELCYYWQHRLSHECRWLWASHAVHHSPRHLNFSAAYRLGWTAGISGHGVFLLPLILLGFHPVAVLATFSFNLLYQFWLHTELVPRLGWLEGILNTPANHRVHHAVNPRYLDRNYGGVLMVFDRLFGTWEPESATESCRYGLVHQLESHNPLRIAFHEWIALWRDLRQARTARAVLGHLFGPPGWRADGSGLTTRVLRQSLLAP